MRERVTFIHGSDAHVDPSALQLQPAGLLGPVTTAVRQDRLTWSLDELPTELASFLRSTSAVHVRWTTIDEHDTLEPFSSRLSPGLFVSFMPATDTARDSKKTLCGLLQAFGPCDCMKAEAFTSDAGTPATLSLHQRLDDLSALVGWSMGELCADTDPVCHSRLRTLYTAASLDVSFDSADRLLKVAAFWPLREQALTAAASDKRRTEVGVFTKDAPPNMGPLQVGLGGLLSVLGEHKEPSPTLFAFSSRHRPSGASFSSGFLAPMGLHPTLQLRLSTDTMAADVDAGECVPYAHLTLPRAVFADRYQLEDKLLLASKNLSALRHSTLPVDLEAPEYATKTWGSSILLELKPPMPPSGQAWTVEVPLHARYLKPTASGYDEVQVPYPAVFWACSSEGAATDLSDNPFDRRHVGYDSLFPPETMFWHATPVAESGTKLVSSLTVPTLREGGEAWVRLGTTAAVALGLAWLVVRLVDVGRKKGEAEGKQ
ncbi:protein pbn1 [Ophiocordyceps camponoti-floridani]|uniref:Protein PBN1 n=1 Tax=Ophiocordyceps camponoti-floridani TaxID=2030778 RepID=A0A8H4VF44_9HYPO|nr:protein pbn1 [Ophiocordyceps camponoti-floridani]